MKSAVRDIKASYRDSAADRPQQDSQPGLSPVAEAIEALATAGGTDVRGAIFTRREVVDFLLDLSGYTSDRSLYRLRLLEPSFGGGDFLLPAIERLLKSWKAHRSVDKSLSKLEPCIRAVELHRDSFVSTKARVVELLANYGIGKKDARKLAEAWLREGDFLLTELPSGFDVVVGNPPYVRQELIPAALLSVYRARYSTMYDRADLYIPFLERSLKLLAEGGVLGFICADRWMKNRYGGLLRKLVAEQFHLKIFVDMVDTPAFHTEVIAYPAITVIARERGTTTRIAHAPEIEAAALKTLASALLSPRKPRKNSGVQCLDSVARGNEPWILDATPQLAIIRRIEVEFPLLEEVGCKVGIGVATGADKEFIGLFEELDVEDDRKIPLVMTRDIQGGGVAWRGYGVINPFADLGGLVDLADYPRLRRYLEARKEKIARRHCVQKLPSNWYRTIDRITPALAKKPKLLIPDIKGEAHVVLEKGEFYPHHNLYFVTSDSWDLEALQAVLLSSVTRLFIATYSTKMRGGFLRFQAQYLRRLRLPKWDKVPARIRQKLVRAGRARDISACNEAAFALYRLSKEELTTLGKIGER